MPSPSPSPVVRLLRELIALPSVNPAFLAPGHAWAGEDRVAERLAADARRAGLSVTFQKVFPGRRNVLVRCTSRARVRQRVLLAPHLDTVGSLDGTDAIFDPVLRGGRVWGRGACDTKGSVAAMFTALLDVARSPQRPAATEIIFAGLVDEESHQHGSRALAKSGLRANLGIVGEPTRLRVVTAHKGDIWLRLATRGKAAHGARPELGENAVHAMAKVVDLLETEYAATLRQRAPHPLLGRPSINVGLIRGGGQPNIVPDHCVIEVDRRTLPGETDAAVKREIAGFLAKRGLKVELVDVKGVPGPPLETDASLSLVRDFLAATGNAQGEGVDYFCDAAVLARGGIPCVVFGPGDIAQAHTAREWISVRSLERGTELLRRFLLSLP